MLRERHKIALESAFSGAMFVERYEEEPMIRRRLSLTTVVVQCACVLVLAQQPNTNLGKDANGNPLRLAVKTGHVSNYDEAKLRPYILPDPLVLADGKRVRDAQ